MAFPVFAPGDVLNASDMNAVGLWLIKSQTIGTTVSSVTVADVFSADYDNYRITVTGGVASASGLISLTLGATSSGYYGGGYYTAYATGTVTGSNNNNAASWGGVGHQSTNALDSIFELNNPFATKRTSLRASFAAMLSGGSGVDNSALNFGGFLDNNTSYTAFTLTAASTTTLTGGTIRVYGYRN
jgi:hypothetical protein